MLLLFLYGLWLVFNARVTPDVALTGLPVAALLYFFCLRFLDYSVRKDLLMLRFLPELCSFLLHLLGDILLSALRVLRLILSSREPAPQLLFLEPSPRTRAGRAMLSDAITLTPGTITVFSSRDRLVVHCLDRSFSANPSDGPAAGRICRLESRFRNALEGKTAGKGGRIG